MWNIRTSISTFLQWMDGRMWGRRSNKIQACLRCNTVPQRNSSRLLLQWIVSTLSDVYKITRLKWQFLLRFVSKAVPKQKWQKQHFWRPRLFNITTIYSFNSWPKPLNRYFFLYPQITFQQWLRVKPQRHYVKPQGRRKLAKVLLI